MNPLARRLHLQAGDQLHRAARSAAYGLTPLLAFPLELLAPIPCAILAAAVITTIFLVGLSAWQLWESRRLQKLALRYNSPLCPPIQL